jgi:D-alanyl-D-alanine carboxypeptidase (penicillin-binding protein 5/6)
LSPSGLRRLALGLVAVLWAAGASQAAEYAPPPIHARAYLVQVQGRTLWAANADARLPPASLTKVMTALLALEQGAMDAVAPVSAAAAGQPGSRLGLEAGDRLRVADLLAATLVRSANDACHALAEHAAGSEARFVARMNRRAAELGLRNTRFANPCGWDARGHYASAGDLAVLAEAALRLPAFAALVAQPEVRIATVDGRRQFVAHNTNVLLGRLRGVAGVKSGFTRRAGPCLIALAERERVRVLAVLLHGSNRWWEAAGLLEHAFAAPAP